ncbi:hypothetical protein Tco_1282093 [Tanacetum coccineum]
MITSLPRDLNLSDEKYKMETIKLTSSNDNVESRLTDATLDDGSGISEEDVDTSAGFGASTLPGIRSDSLISLKGPNIPSVLTFCLPKRKTPFPQLFDLMSGLDSALDLDGKSSWWFCILVALDFYCWLVAVVVSGYSTNGNFYPLFVP